MPVLTGWKPGALLAGWGGEMPSWLHVAAASAVTGLIVSGYALLVEHRARDGDYVATCDIGPAVSCSKVGPIRPTVS